MIKCGTLIKKTAVSYLIKYCLACLLYWQWQRLFNASHILYWVVYTDNAVTEQQKIIWAFTRNSQKKLQW